MLTILVAGRFGRPATSPGAMSASSTMFSAAFGAEPCASDQVVSTPNQSTNELAVRPGRRTHPRGVPDKRDPTAGASGRRAAVHHLGLVAEVVTALYDEP